MKRELSLASAIAVVLFQINIKQSIILLVFKAENLMFYAHACIYLYCNIIIFLYSTLFLLF